MNLYALVDPRTEEIRYIGKTIQSAEKRFRDHISDARQNFNTHKCNWIRSLLDQDLLPILMILRNDIELEDHLNTEEISMIAFCREIGMRLVNSTNGGDGVSGLKITPETRAKMAKAKIGKPGPRLGKSVTQETRDKISQSLKGRVGCNLGKHWSEETRQKISAGMMGKIIPQEQRVRRSRAVGGRSVVDEKGNVYLTLGEAAAATGVSKGTIWHTINGGKGLSRCGHKFKYLDEK